MKQYIAISKDKLIEGDQLLHEAVLLWKDEDTLEESNQYAIRVDESNEAQFRGYTKYDSSQIKAARDNKLTLEECKKALSKPTAWAAKYDEDGNKFFKRLHSGDEEGVNPYIDIAAGENAVIEIEVDYLWAKIEAMEIVGAGKKHSASLWVLDTDTNTYSQAPVEVVGANYPLNQFSFNACIAEDFHRFHSDYDADLYMGMHVRIQVFNYSDTTSSVGLNIELNEVKQ